MHPKARIAALAATTLLGAMSLSAPALAASSPHWAKSQCQTWEKGFVKRNPHASKSHKASANKVLSAHACSIRVK